MPAVVAVADTVRSGVRVPPVEDAMADDVVVVAVRTVVVAVLLPDGREEIRRLCGADEAAIAELVEHVGERLGGEPGEVASDGGVEMPQVSFGHVCVRREGSVQKGLDGLRTLLSRLRATLPLAPIVLVGWTARVDAEILTVVLFCSVISGFVVSFALLLMQLGQEEARM